MRGLAIGLLMSGMLMGVSRCEQSSTPRMVLDAGTAGKGGATGGTAGKGGTTAKPSQGKTECGPSTCDEDEICCNRSCGICTKEGEGCTKQLCLPDDADAGQPKGEPCGPVTCDPGKVCCNKSCGICTEPDGFCTEQFCETPDAGTTPPFCGGIAGFTCPGAGTCADNPSDDCDPNKGGADCGGVCECLALGLCIDGFVWDESPDVCDCVAVPDACAAVRCRAGTECRVQSDGTAACVPNGPSCAGLVGGACPGLGDCIDDPSDACGGDQGGDDCIGICVCEVLAKCMADQVFDNSPEVCACTDQLTNPCAAVLCPQGTRCEVQQVQCIRATCPAQAICVAP